MEGLIDIEDVREQGLDSLHVKDASGFIPEVRTGEHNRLAGREAHVSRLRLQQPVAPKRRIVFSCDGRTRVRDKKDYNKEALFYGEDRPFIFSCRKASPSGNVPQLS